MKNNKKGFTLIELMIVVAIIGILAAIAIPKFASLIDKSKEGATKGALSSVRGALQVYYGDNEGWFPTDLLGNAVTDSLVVGGKYINAIPVAKIPTRHGDSAVVAAQTGDAFGTEGGSGGWSYFNVNTKPAVWGTFVVNCTHYDLKGTTLWTAF